jgi:hypothetical protein
MGEYFLFDLTGTGRSTFERELGRDFSLPLKTMLTSVRCADGTAPAAAAEYRSLKPGSAFDAGWSAGRQASLLSAVQIRGAANQNPHETDPERQSWAAGFAKGAE